MHCLSENAAMMHIARRAGIDVVVEMGPGRRLPRPVPGEPDLADQRGHGNERVALSDCG